MKPSRSDSVPGADRAALDRRVLRVGVVGLGWAGETHVKAYRALGGVDVVALAGLEGPRLKSLGEAYGISGLHESWEELVEREDLDAVSVCAPNYLHAPVTIAALEAGKHVLCEKPLARSAGEAEAMVDAARRFDRVLHTAFNHRERGDVAVLKAYTERGGLGRIYHAKASWMRRRGIPTIGSWFTSREMAGGGSLIDLGVHVLDIALHLLGEPQVRSVSAATYAELGPHGRGAADHPGKMDAGSPFEVEDLASAFIRLEGGATLLLEASWATHSSAGDDFGIKLYGSDGGAEIDVRNYAWANTLRIFTDVAGVPAEIRPDVAPGEGHVAVVRAFATAIRSGNWADHRGQVGLARTRIVDACYRSALGGREVPL